MLRALAKTRWIHATRIETIYGLVDLMDVALASGALLDMPLFVMYGAKDEIVPQAPIRHFVGSLPAEPMHRPMLAWYQNGYHMLLRDLEGPVVIADVQLVLAPAARYPRVPIAAAEAFAPRRAFTGRPVTGAPWLILQLLILLVLANGTPVVARILGERFVSAGWRRPICRRKATIRPIKDTWDSSQCWRRSSAHRWLASNGRSGFWSAALPWRAISSPAL
jgi:hypothetical protein